MFTVTLAHNCTLPFCTPPRYVLKNPRCGRYFHFGITDGYCQCIGKQDEKCILAALKTYHSAGSTDRTSKRYKSDASRPAKSAGTCLMCVGCFCQCLVDNIKLILEEAEHLAYLRRLQQTQNSSLRWTLLATSFEHATGAQIFNATLSVETFLAV